MKIFLAQYPLFEKLIPFNLKWLQNIWMLFGSWLKQTNCKIEMISEIWRVTEYLIVKD